jgi:predicted dehydrogenase
MTSQSDPWALGVSRREFLKGSAAVSAAAALAGLAPGGVFAAGSDRIRVGLVGCGGRGNGALGNCLEAAKIVGHPVQVWAVGDLFEDRASTTFNGLKARAQKEPETFAITQERVFTGFDNYQKVLASGVDLVLLATPPGFRAVQFPAVIKAGKHVFMEKPVCVDPWGYHQVCQAADEAKEKKLTVVAGTQRRHETARRENLKRIHDGAIGDLVAGQCYWLGGPVTHNRPRAEGQSDIEWQIRNWYAWCWTCGDHIVEQHVHNIDMICWAFAAHPKSAKAVGGRQARPEPGNIYDHFAVEFEFPSGARVASYCSHFRGASGRVGENVVGTKGSSALAGGIEGADPWRYSGPGANAMVQEHVDCLNSLLGKGEYWNEGRQVAESSMAAVLGRMSAYTGAQISWDWAMTSKLRLGKEGWDWHSFGDFTPPPVAVPGVTKLV